MTPVGYKTSLEEMERYLGTCTRLLTFVDKNGEKSYCGVPNPEIEVEQAGFLERQGCTILSAEPLETSRIKEIAKFLTDRFAKNIYGYIQCLTGAESSDLHE